jgi:hypothetical protein
MLNGRCLCGAISYEVDQPALGEAVCHCKHCQRQAGSAFAVVIAVRSSAFKLTGETMLYTDRGDSGAEVHRHFCGTCGSPIYSALPAKPKVVFIKAGTLDDTSTLAPKHHVWCDRAWPWTPFPADAVKVAKEP